MLAPMSLKGLIMWLIEDEFYDIFNSFCGQFDFNENFLVLDSKIADEIDFSASSNKMT